VLELQRDAVLIGVDAGATEVKAHQVLVLSKSGPLDLGLGTASASCCYDRVLDFAPVAIDEQLAALAAGGVEPTAGEREQGRHWVHATVASIVAVAAQARRRRAVVGIGAPGLKTADGRGLAVVRNGPRIPDYAQRIEEGVRAAGIELVRAIGPLGGDGDNCGRGEEVDRHGQFRDVANAYYVGGGTGLAEALKLRGRLVSMDAVREWMPKAWRMTSERGRNFEDSLSTRGINAQYAADSGEPDPIDHDEFPEVRAQAGDVIADAVMKEAAVTLAELVFDRMLRVRRGIGVGQVPGVRNVEQRHPYLGTFLDRVVIGQRLGRIFGDPHLVAVFRQRVEEALAQRLRGSPYVRMRARYLHKERLRPGFLRASRLRVAPALGAAAAALEAPARPVARAGAPETRGEAHERGPGT
jgi:hypothetical protein